MKVSEMEKRTDNIDEVQPLILTKIQPSLSQQNIESCILNIRNKQVILDQDLALLYGVETKYLNRQVKRNIERFPEDFMFQLTKEEMASILRCQNVTSKRGGRRYASYAFTEQGIAMLSGVLRSSIAIDVNIRIMRAFVAVRTLVNVNVSMFNRIETIEHNQLILNDTIEQNNRILQLHSEKIDEVFRRLEDKKTQPAQGIFFDGQIFDAYTFVCSLVKQAKSSIILIDNYIDETVLTLLDKRDDTVSATIYTQSISAQLRLDISRHNAQYAPIEVNTYRCSHDRFLCIDETVYHIGASTKDLGKKWFAFAILEDTKPIDLVNKINGTV